MSVRWCQGNSNPASLEKIISTPSQPYLLIARLSRGVLPLFLGRRHQGTRQKQVSVCQNNAECIRDCLGFLGFFILIIISFLYFFWVLQSNLFASLPPYLPTVQKIFAFSSVNPEIQCPMSSDMRDSRLVALRQEVVFLQEGPAHPFMMLWQKLWTRADGQKFLSRPWVITRQMA